MQFWRALEADSEAPIGPESGSVNLGGNIIDNTFSYAGPDTLVSTGTCYTGTLFCGTICANLCIMATLIYLIDVYQLSLSVWGWAFILCMCSMFSTVVQCGKNTWCHEVLMGPVWFFVKSLIALIGFFDRIFWQGIKELKIGMAICMWESAVGVIDNTVLWFSKKAKKTILLIISQKDQ